MQMTRIRMVKAQSKKNLGTSRIVHGGMAEIQSTLIKASKIRSHLWLHLSAIGPSMESLDSLKVLQCRE